MPRSFHPHLHPPFVSVLSSHRCENSQAAFTTVAPFTHTFRSLATYNPARFHVQTDALINQDADMRLSRLSWQ